MFFKKILKFIYHKIVAFKKRVKDILIKIIFYKKKIICFGNTIKKIDKTAKISIKNDKILFNIPKNGELSFFDYFKKYRGAMIKLYKDSTLICNGKVTFYSGSQLLVTTNSILTFNGRCSLNKNATLICRNKITIGNNVLIAQNVVIRDSDGHPINGKIGTKPILISDNVWIATNAIILKGVTIGEGSVVGAGAVVTHDVPPHTIVAGNPAKVIKENITWRWH